MKIYISHDKVSHSIIPDEKYVIVKDVPELANDHEEADTKLHFCMLIMHQKHHLQYSLNVQTQMY